MLRAGISHTWRRPMAPATLQAAFPHRCCQFGSAASLGASTQRVARLGWSNRALEPIALPQGSAMASGRGFDPSTKRVHLPRPPQQPVRIHDGQGRQRLATSRPDPFGTPPSSRAPNRVAEQPHLANPPYQAVRSLEGWGRQYHAATRHPECLRGDWFGTHSARTVVHRIAGSESVLHSYLPTRRLPDHTTTSPSPSRCTDSALA
jgi:hypothetical protein